MPISIKKSVKKKTKHKKQYIRGRRNVSRMRYAPELYSGVLQSHDVNPNDGMFVGESPNIVMIDVSPKRTRPYVGGISPHHGGTKYDPSVDIYIDTINKFLEEQPTRQPFMEEPLTHDVPNVYNIPFFYDSYHLPRNTPPGGWKKILQIIKDNRQYNRDANDFAYKHRLMRDSEIKDRYWTNDGMFYMDINIYDDIERKRALIELYKFRRNQSVDKATDSLLKHKYELHNKRGGQRDISIPAEKIAKAFSILTVGGGRQKKSEPQYGGVVLKRYPRKTVNHSNKKHKYKKIKQTSNRK